MDINPRQLQYAQARAGGAPLREGVAERMLQRGRAFLPLFGWSEKRRREFLLLRNPVEQVYFCQQTLDSLPWRLLLGESPATTESPVRAIRFVCADAATYLESAGAASVDAFSLSNITDGASPSYVQRLHRAVKHTAAPGALVVTRNFAEPASAENNCAARDRSALWGSVRVQRTGDLDLCSTC